MFDTGREPTNKEDDRVNTFQIDLALIFRDHTDSLRFPIAAKEPMRKKGSPEIVNPVQAVQIGLAIHRIVRVPPQPIHCTVIVVVESRCQVRMSESGLNAVSSSSGVGTAGFSYPSRYTPENRVIPATPFSHPHRVGFVRILEVHDNGTGATGSGRST